MGISDKKQLTLFQEANVNPVSRLKAAMREAMRSGKLSREEIVDRMNELARRDGLGDGRGKRITVAALDGWVAKTKGNLIPVGLLPCFCRVTGSLEPLRVLAACVGALVISQEEALLLEAARVEREQRRLAKRRRQLQALLEE